MKTAILSLTRGGHELAVALAARLPEAAVVDGGPVARQLAENWKSYEGFICIMAAGIVVRSIAPLLRDKMIDPCVVVVDEKGCFAVSLLAGHLGGGNDLARQVAMILGGQAVITTASDTLGLTPIDLWAEDQGLAVSSRSMLTKASAQLVSQGLIKVFSEVDGPLPPDFHGVNEPGFAQLIISYKTGHGAERLQLYPPQLVVGVGCNRGTAEEEIAQALRELFDQYCLALPSVLKFASIDLKRDEAGLISFAERYNRPIDFFSKQQLNQVAGVSCSDVVMKAVGAQGVAEPAALLAAGSDQLIVRKEKWKNVTLAVATANFTLSEPAPVILTT